MTPTELRNNLALARMSQRDLAREAGVSISTVSNVLRADELATQLARHLRRAARERARDLDNITQGW